jgi:membrane protein required for colicin V production
MHTSILDIVLAIIFVSLVIQAGFSGFVREVTGVAWVIIGLLFGFAFYGRGAGYIVQRGLLDGMAADTRLFVAKIIAFIALFVVTALVIKLIGFFLSSIVESVGLLSAVDRVLGAAFGILKGIVVVGFILFLLRVQPFVDTGPMLGRSNINRAFSPAISHFEKNVHHKNNSGGSAV